MRSISSDSSFLGQLFSDKLSENVIFAIISGNHLVRLDAFSDSFCVITFTKTGWFPFPQPGKAVQVTIDLSSSSSDEENFQFLPGAPEGGIPPGDPGCLGSRRCGGDGRSRRGARRDTSSPRAAGGLVVREPRDRLPALHWSAARHVPPGLGKRLVKERPALPR